MDPHRPVKPDPGQANNAFVKPERPDRGSPLSDVPRYQQYMQRPANGANGGIKPDPDAPSLSAKPAGADKLGPSHDEDADQDADNQPEETNYLERLVTQDSPEVLETGVTVGMHLLDRVRNALETFDSPDVDAWFKTIQELRDRAKPTRTVVGVVGNTGAGKSSVINALLDEERLLPTNCLRACTASPTEISFNYSDDPSELYRAEIEFISASDWAKELATLYSDLLDGNGDISRDCTNPDSDAGIAYAKVKAVYPQKTKEMLARADAKSLAEEPAVRGVLGSFKVLKEEVAQDLYRRMQHYVDSKEKSIGEKKRDIPMEYWPLIKVVRIFTKANALSTGAVIVDLPGVQDSNAARAAVAANYMKSCTGLWIVAPINRAVDDKTAKSLLGDSFKRQLKYDGTYSAVSFICSKTDDISITEAAESLGLEEETSDSWERAERLENKRASLRYRIASLKETKLVLADQLDDCETKTDVWEDLESKIADGKTVYAPPDNPKKRKRAGGPSRTRKNLDSSDVDDDMNDSDLDLSDKENSQSDPNRTPLTEEDVEKMIASIKAQRRQIREERRAIDGQIAGFRKDMETAQQEREVILAEIKAVCVKGRNEYSRGAIKQDFAMGIKELDQENAAEEDDTTFDPDQDVRDYDEVARTLPVFCVSSRAYQKLTGRLVKDDFQAHGFLSVEDTEVPKLQEHAKKLTEAGRASHCRRLLNDLTQLVNSLKLWSASNGTESHLTDVEKRREEHFLRKLLNQLEQGFRDSVAEAIHSIEEALDEQVYTSFDSSIPAAIAAAPATANGWGAPRPAGGMYWSTYKATVRREGVYSGASGPRDFNQELFDPISRNLANGWERAFQRRLPKILKDFAKQTNANLNEFQRTAKKRAEERHTNVSSLVTLSNQIVAYMRTLDELPNSLGSRITELQREASREFTPVIGAVMQDVYDRCAMERGMGQYNRMKLAMGNHVESHRSTMFRQATDTVKARLQGMCRNVQQTMIDSTAEIFDAVFRDYMGVFVGQTVDRRARMSPQELEMRKQVNNVILLGDRMFAPVLGISHSEAAEDADGVPSAPSPGHETESGLPGPAHAADAAPKVKREPANRSAAAGPSVTMYGAADIDMAMQADEMMQALIRDQST
ncbi:Uu.00g042090.m01.CDS01 [Anthostomella pinea]|uniref:Uu.00g042090.m01.CDS01 n=1 Tax=Anthostomella pinea TaxID=933095 RepID=A0AAI8VBI8_9PEZI|nr:Uu.00g042090.m01.CDS01 [Anthostomella pinea]